MGRYIILANPATCQDCHKTVRAGRVGYWHMGAIWCCACMGKKGQAKMTPDEKAMLDELQPE